MEYKLKPCPFCGSKKVYLREDDVGVGSQVYCRSCHAMMDNLGTPDENVEAWNRRAENKEGSQYMN